MPIWSPLHESVAQFRQPEEEALALSPGAASLSPLSQPVSPLAVIPQPLEGLQGMAYWEPLLRGWATVPMSSATPDSGPRALWMALRASGRAAPDIKDLKSLVGIWASSSFLETNSALVTRGGLPYPNVTLLYDSFAESQTEPWGSTHLALACLACGCFPVILAPDKRDGRPGLVDCKFNLQPVRDIIRAHPVREWAAVLVFYWTRRRTYKHFQVLLPPVPRGARMDVQRSAIASANGLPREILDQLNACAGAGPVFDFSCNYTPSGDADCRSTGRDQVALKTRVTGTQMQISLPRDFETKLQSYMLLLNSIILSEVQKDEIKHILLEHVRPSMEDPVKRLGFEKLDKAEGVFKRAVRSPDPDDARYDVLYPPDLLLPWPIETEPEQ